MERKQKREASRSPAVGAVRIVPGHDLAQKILYWVLFASGGLAMFFLVLPLFPIGEGFYEGVPFFCKFFFALCL